MQRSILLAAMCQLFCLANRPAVAQVVASRFVAGADVGSLQLIGRYLKSAEIRKAAARGVEMEAEIGAKVPKLARASTLRALRRTSCAGQVTYKALYSSGDVLVKKEVIARYLAAESQVRDADALAITAANYEFRLKGAVKSELHYAYIFRLKPKKKSVGLFKGELWLDGETGMPLREAGQFVKVPSIFLKRIRFIRDYQIRDGVSVPQSIECTVETRWMGRAELSVQYHHFTYEGCGDCDLREPSVLNRGAYEKTQ